MFASNASRRPRGRAAARRALWWALLPPAFGVVGALYGAAFWGYLRAFEGRVADDPAMIWARLGCTILFGVFVALVPTLWALVLFKRRPAALA